MSDQKKLSKTGTILALFDADQDVFTLAEIQTVLSGHFKKLYEESLKASEIIPFGKYKGKKIDKIAQFDVDYLRWLVKQDFMQKYEACLKTIQERIKG